MQPRTTRPRIADVAREAGVSKTAVSFAFNSPERLAAGTAVRIRDVADRLGYAPDPVARMLNLGETRTIGILTPQSLSVSFSNPFFARFGEGVAIAAEESGYALYLISPLYGSLAQAMGRAAVDGVIAVGLSVRHPDVAQIRRSGIPIVMVDSSALPDHASVEVDDIGGAAMAAEHLLALGHRDVLIIAVEPPDPWSTIDPETVTGRRLSGYRAAFSSSAIDIPDTRIVVGPATIEGGAAAIDSSWGEEDPPTAVLAMSDAMAVGAMRALQGRGIDVPRDVSVIGFDDIDLARHADPPLTTVHQPIRQKGQESVRLLLGLITRRARPEHLLLGTHLVIRGSTGPARPRSNVVEAR